MEIEKGMEQCDKCDYFISVEEAYRDGYKQALEDVKKELLIIYYRRYMHDIYIDDIENVIEKLNK